MYTDRTHEVCVIKSIDSAIHLEGSWSFGYPKDVRDELFEGGMYILETKGFNTIGGFAAVYPLTDGTYTIDKWIWHKTDEDIQRERDEWLADYERRKQETLEKNFDDWTARTAALPESYQNRLNYFNEKSNGKFQLEGWGYELVICELAVMYEATDGVDTDEINDYASQHGTSGNQHGFAKALARTPADQRAGTVSALSPLTGDAHYEGK